MKARAGEGELKRVTGKRPGGRRRVRGWRVVGLDRERGKTRTERKPV